MEFKDRLRALRKENNMTQADLGQKLNYGYSAIANYETGRNQPSISDLMKIAETFDVSIDYLLCVTDVRRPFVITKETAAFSEFHQFYTQLNEESRDDLLAYMRYLLFKQKTPAVKEKSYGEQTLKPMILKAAQKPEEYK
ncbi:MAG: helix-turn-helix transcriptional regulator [Anaerotignum sp.]|nr:helix-turn-helix transcriptional regulator [Anaerotignum sp.]